MSAPFRVVCSDPPWNFRDGLPGEKRGAKKHYETTGHEEIARFVVPPTHEDSVLFMWFVSSMPEEALRVVRAWQYVPKAMIVWRKTYPCKCGAYTVESPLVALDGDRCPYCEKQLTRWFGMGRVTRAEHETVIVAKRGRPQVNVKNIRSVFAAPAAKGEHSRKPESFYKAIVEKLYPGPYLELFARRPREGWTTLGLELGTPMDVLA